MLTLSNVKLIDAGDMSSSITGSSLEIREAQGFAIQAVWSGATGASTSDLIVVQGSLDDSTFSTIESIPLVASTSGSIIKNYASQMYPYIRISYTKSTTSDGDLTVRVSVKG